MAFVTIEDRVDRLEALFGQFLTEMALVNKRADERNRLADERNRLADERMARFENEMREFKDEMREFKDEMREFKDESQRERASFLKGMDEFKAEMRQSKKEMDKKWGELSNKLGHIIEDVLAPNLPRLAESHFLFSTVQQFSIRILKKQSSPKVRWFEVDALVVGPDALIVGEAKSTPSLDHADAFAAKLAEFPSWFPEYKDYKVIGIFGSWSVSPPVIERLTQLGIYALGMGDDNMELLNAKSLETSKTVK